MRRLLSKFLAVSAVIAGLALGTASVPAVAGGVSPAQLTSVALPASDLGSAAAAPDDWWF